MATMDPLSTQQPEHASGACSNGTIAEKARAEPDYTRGAYGNGYTLGQGHLGAVRLNLIHELWQRILKFVIHPRVELPASSPPAIADVCSGTGLWAIDAAQARPDARVHAMDLTIAKAPPAQWLPANLRLSEWDVFRDPPAELLGSFDLLHMRLVVLVFSGIDPVPVLRRFRALLKPGGWLQWEDLDPVHSHVKRVSPDLHTPNLDGAVEMSKAGGRHDWLLRLPEILTAAGFVDAEATEYPNPPELARALSDVALMTIGELGEGLLQRGKVEAGEKVMKMVAAGYEESLKGAAFAYPRLACVARKPLE